MRNGKATDSNHLYAVEKAADQPVVANSDQHADAEKSATTT